MRTLSFDSRARFALFFTAGTIITLLSGLHSGFHVDGNDFWSSVFYGRNMIWSEPRSWYNGFYPFGYAFLVGQMPYTYVIQLSYILNAGLAGLFAASISCLIAEHESLPATLLAFACSAFYPLIYIYANTPGPDMGTAAFPAFAVYWLWRDSFRENGKKSVRYAPPILAGVALGLGFLWRTHALVLAVIILALTLAFRLLPSMSATAAMFAVFLVFVFMQVAVDVASGHMPFETAQAFNVYKFLYSVDWTHTPTANDLKGFSVLGLVFKDPLFVWNAAFPYLANMLSYAAPALAGYALTHKGGLKKFFLFSTLSIVLYAFPLSLSDSPRGQLPILGLYLPSLIFLCAEIARQIAHILPPVRWLRTAAALVVFSSLLPALSQWIKSDRVFIVRNKISHGVFRAMEYDLAARGMKSPDEIFSTKYQVYMPTTPPYIPRQINDWTYNWFWGFSEKYPPIPNDSWEAFRKACLEQNIKFLIIAPAARSQSDFFRAIYDGDFSEEEMGIEYLRSWANMRVYKFVPNLSTP